MSYSVTNVTKGQTSVSAAEAIETNEDAPPIWHPELIKAQVRMRGMTLTRLATRNGLDASACRVALLRPLPKAEQAISAYLGVPLHVLWPDRYDAEGRRFRHVREQSSHERDAAHRLSAGAR